MNLLTILIKNNFCYMKLITRNIKAFGMNKRGQIFYCCFEYFSNEYRAIFGAIFIF